MAAFGSVGFDITDRWDVTAELRFARDTVGNFNTVRTPPLSEAEYDTWSPRVTTGFKLTPDSMVYLNVAEGHKPGVINADPRFPESIRLADPESAWTYEIGSKNTFMNGRLTANIAAYFTDWTDQQITSAFTFPTGGTQSFITNAGKSEIKGLEIELSGRVTDNFSAGLTYSYIDAQFKELNDAEAAQLFGNPSVAGNRLFGVPENQGSIFGKYSFPMGNLGQGYFRVDASYTSKKYDQIFNLAHTGEQELVNLALGMDGEHWSAQLFVKNLTDDRTPSSVTRYVDQLNLNVPST
ncbi:MAG: TonB-dependent receptor [Gammaproteobacteria bacterium]|nr:TonB-dependent receptor [Gammaproteobacteria bacterium]